MGVDEAGGRRRYEDSGLAEPVPQRGRGNQHRGKGQREYQRDREAERLSWLGIRHVLFAQGPDREAGAVGCRGNAGANQRERKRAQRGDAGGCEHHGHQNDGGDGRERRACDRRGDDAGTFLNPRSHGADGRGAGDETRCEPCDREAKARPEQPNENVSGGADRHHQYDDNPDRARIERVIGSHRLIGQQREDHQCRAGEDQRVPHLRLGQHRTDEMMQRSACREQHGKGDGDAGRQCGLLHRETAEQRGQHQGNLGGKARVLVAGSEIGDGRQRGHARNRDGQHQRAAHHHAGCPGQRDDRERADSRRRAGRAFPFAALPLGADQKPDAERHREVQEQGREIEHVASCSSDHLSAASRSPSQRPVRRPPGSQAPILMQIIAECAALWEATSFATRFARRKSQ